MQKGENSKNSGDNASGSTGWEAITALGNPSQENWQQPQTESSQHDDPEIPKEYDDSKDLPSDLTDEHNDDYNDMLSDPVDDELLSDFTEEEYDEDFSSPEMQYFEDLDRLQEFLPDFKSDATQLLHQAYTNTASPSNNLFTSAAYLPTLTQVAANPEIKIELLDAITEVAEEYAKQHQYDDEETDPYIITLELLDKCLDNIVQWRASSQINDSTMQDALNALSNLHKKIPLEPIRSNFYRFSISTPEQYLRRQNYQHYGIIDQDFINQLQDDTIARSFEEAKLPVPESLQSLSPKVHQFWNEQSEKLGYDALQKYTDYITRNYFRSNHRSSNESTDQFAPSPANFFTPEGMPSPAGFISNGPVFYSLDLYGYSGQKDNLNFIQAFSEYLPSKEKFLFDGVVNLQDNPQLANYFTRILSRDAEKQASLFDKQDNPTDEFWNLVNYNSDLSAIKAFADYEKHFSPERIAAANLDPTKRRALSEYLNSNYPNYDYEDAVDFIDDIITVNGELSEDFFEHQTILEKISAENLARSFPEQLSDYFSLDQINYLELHPEYRKIIIEASIPFTEYGIKYSDFLKAFVDESGPTALLANQAFQKGHFDLLADEPLRRDDNQQLLSENQLYALEHYQELIKKYNSRDLANTYANTVARFNLDQLTHEQIDDLVRLSQRVATSNALELRHSGQNFLLEITTSNNPNEKLAEIEQVFLHNNLPYVGKVFRTFQIIHPAEQFDTNFASATHRGVLANLPNTGTISREAVLFADLLKSSLGSNNRSMRKYIQNLRDGQILSNQILNHEVQYEQLDPTDQQVLQAFLSHLETTYNQTQAAKDNKFALSGNIEQDLINLNQKFQTSERYSLADRVVRSFGYMLGIKSLTDLEDYINSNIQNADARNRQRFQEQAFSLQSGDLVKAIDARYFEQILQNGSVCKEFLNGLANSDATPLDTDLTRLDDNTPTDTIDHAIDWKNEHASIAASTIHLVIKNSPVLQYDGSKYDPTKLEVFQNDDSDYGIRTGFPSSAIDFIISDPSDNFQPSLVQEQRQQIFFEIAKNGFYIPVVDRHSGECIFSPADYQKLRNKLSGLSEYGMPRYFFASDDDLFATGINEISQIALNHQPLVDYSNNQINVQIDQILHDHWTDFQGLKDCVDGDLTPGFIELLNTGSTGRGTDVPDTKIDFDYIMRIDASIYNDDDAKSRLINLLREHLPHEVDNSNSSGLRLDGVKIDGLDDTVKIDISLVQRTNQLSFSSDQAIQQRLDTIRRQAPEKYPAVLANIILAKKILGDANAYKPDHSSEIIDPDLKGGLGGIGIENWILQNGGSFKTAARSFLEAADQAQGNFYRFKAIYPIWDPGQNHFVIRNNERAQEQSLQDNPISYQSPFDNFVVANMSEGGFRRMVNALRNYLNITS